MLNLVISHANLFHKFQVIWEAICEMLLHPHSWIRSRSVHLIAQYFAHIVDTRKENNQKSLGSYFLMSPSRLFHIAASLCCQLKTPLDDDADSNLMNQTIVFSIGGVHSVMGQIACLDPSVFWSTLEQHDKTLFLQAFDLLDSRKGRSMFLPLTSSIHEPNNQQGANNVQHVLVSSLLRKMGKIALQMEAVQVCMQAIYIHIHPCLYKCAYNINNNTLIVQCRWE